MLITHYQNKCNKLKFQQKMIFLHHYGFIPHSYPYYMDNSKIIFFY